MIMVTKANDKTRIYTKCIVAKYLGNGSIRDDGNKGTRLDSTLGNTPDNTLDNRCCVLPNNIPVAL